MRQPLQLLSLLVITLLLGCSYRVFAQDVASARPFQTGGGAESKTNNQKELKVVLAEIESQNQVFFNYNSELVRNKYVSIKEEEVKRRNLESYLRNLLKPFGLKLEKLREGEYLIYAPGSSNNSSQLRLQNSPVGESANRNSSPDSIKSAEAMAAAAVAVTGKVTAQETGEGIPGVNVTVKGTTNGTVTDVNGNYTINVDGEQTVLVFSYIGYTTKEVTVGSQNVVDVTLVADVQALSEVVVVGYGTQERRNLTGSVGSISEREIKAVPVNTFEQALQGRVAGVQVSQSNGAPGGGVQIRVRGIGSITQNSEPLYVVDGLPIYGDNFTGVQPLAGQAGSGRGTNPGGSALASINPNDIESIEVLKDASATAIYGSRGANGVIIITTKRGKTGRSSVNFNAYYGLQQARRFVPLLNGYQFALLQNEARLNHGGERINAIYANPYSFGKGTDWQDETFRVAPMQNYNLSVMGGSEKTQFAISGDYFNQQGIILNTGFERISARMNIDHQISKKIKIGISLAPSYQYGNILNTDNVFGGRLLGALRAQPTLPVYAPDGVTYAGPPPGADFGETRNAVAEFERDINDLARFRTLGNLYAELVIAKGLTFRSTLGGDIMYTKQKFVEPVFQLFGGQQNNRVLIRTNNSDYINYNTVQQLSYDHTFGQLHSLNALIGFEAQSFTSSGIDGEGRGAINNTLTTYSNNTQNQRFNGYANKAGLVSYFARANYSFNDKYLLTATIRTDGSSRFSPGRKWGVFPSASIGWRVSQEAFMSNVTAIQDLKLRASYGLTGNQNIGDFQYLALATSRDYVFGNSPTTGVAPTSFASPELQWEAQKQFDAGLDFSLFNGRIGVTADYFIKTSDRLLLNVELPGTAGGASSILVNLGEVQNRGFELAVRTENLTGALRWTTEFNVATLRNEITSLGDNPGGGRNEYLGNGFFFLDRVNKTVEGQPISAFWVFEANGIYQSQEEINAMNRDGNIFQRDVRVGDVRYVDQDNNGILDDKDRIFAGTPFPKLFGGLSNTFEYKGFSLNVFANFSSGNKIYNGGRVYVSRDAYWNMDGSFADRWTPANPNTDVPRIAGGGSQDRNTRPSTRFLEDGSFIRIRNINLGYNLPQALAKRILMQNARVYVSVTNAFTFTNYRGYDPEVNSLSGNPQSQGVDLVGYPLPRIYTLGISSSF